MCSSDLNPTTSIETASQKRIPARQRPPTQRTQRHYVLSTPLPGRSHRRLAAPGSPPPPFASAAAAVVPFRAWNGTSPPSVAPASPLLTSRSARRRPQRASRPSHRWLCLRPHHHHLASLSLQVSLRSLSRWCELVCLGVGRGQERSAVSGGGVGVGPAVSLPRGWGLGAGGAVLAAGRGGKR